MAVPVPYAPTATGRAAARRAGAYGRDRRARRRRRRRTQLTGGPTGPVGVPDVEALDQAALGSLRRGVQPAYDFDPILAAVAAAQGQAPSSGLRENDPEGYELAEDVFRGSLPSQDIRSDPLAELLIGGIASGGLGALAGLLGRGARGAVGAAGATEGAAGTQAANQAAQALRAAARASRAGGRAARTGGRAAGRAARATGRAATYPLRHPIQTAAAGTAPPILAESPGAAIEGDPARLMRALEGTGVLATALGDAGESVGEGVGGLGGNLAADAISLPAQVLPSAYFIGAAGVEAAQGDTERAGHLWQDFTEESAYPALATGDFDEAAQRAYEHPLYTGLEGVGGAALAGRGLGMAARRGALGDDLRRTASREQRPDIPLYGDLAIKQGRRSGNLLTALAQQARDRRVAERGPSDRQFAAALRDRHMRTESGNEQVRRSGLRAGDEALGAVLREAGGEATGDAVALGVQRVARDPERAMSDLRDYRENLIAERPNLVDEHGIPLEGRQRANDATVERIDAALADGRPEALIAASNEFIRHQQPVQAGLHERGIFVPEQTERASALGFLRQHEGAGHGLSKADQLAEAAVLAEMKKPDVSPTERGQLAGQLSSIRSRAQILTKEGDPFTTEMIQQALARHGVEAPGMVSNKPGELSRGGSYYRPATERPTGSSQRATGQAVAQGTSNTGFEQLALQHLSQRSILEQAKGYDRMGREYGLAKPDGTMFKSRGEFQAMVDSPGDFGMQLPDIPGGWTYRLASPWPQRATELAAARQHGQPASADVPTFTGPDAERFMAEAMQRAFSNEVDGPGMAYPAMLAKAEQRAVAPKGPVHKTIEGYTGLWKGFILPGSPGWIAGNVGDIGMRTAVAGVTPGDIRSGHGLQRIAERVLSPEDLAFSVESLLPGGMYTQRQRIQPHRSHEQVVGETVEPIWKAVAVLRESRGTGDVWKAYKKYRDAVFHYEGKFVERMPQYGMLAKVARQELGMSRRQFRKAVDAQSPVVEDFVRGWRDQGKLDNYAKQLEAVYGNWHKMGPEARRYMTSISPFWMWARAATKFAFVTLPRDHPTLTGIIAASEQMTREERQKVGLDFSGEEPLPPFAQGGVPLPGGGTLRLSNLSTFGAFADYPAFLSSMVAPQFSSALLSGLGLDWKGDQLVDSEGRPASAERKALAAALSTGEGFIPFMNVAQQIVDRGFKGVLPARDFDPEATDFMRSLSESRQINVPVTDSGSGPGGGVVGAEELKRLVSPSGGDSSGPVTADEISKLLNP